MNKQHIFSALFISSALLVQSCGNGNQNQAGQAQQGERAVTVTTATVSKEIVSGTKTYPANIVPLQETEIRAEVSGYITGIFVADGAYVNKGQRLYEIDRVRYQAAVDQAKANLEIAKANLERVQKDLQRYQTLAEKDAIAKQTLDYATTDVSNQKAQVLAAEAALTTARTNLNRSVIVAPFSGVIGISQVRNGALVSAGSTLLNTISSTTPIAAEFQISEKEIAEFTNLQQGKSNTEISLSLPDGSQYASPGKVTTIDRAVDRQTGTLKVRASFANAQNQLRAGMNVSVNLESTSSEEALVIPYKAVFEQLGSFNVYTVNDSSRVDLKQVTLGHSIRDKVIVKEGLQFNERIVIEGVSTLRQGAKITEANTETK